MYYIAKSRPQHGFSMIEVLISLLITVGIMSSVFLLLQRGQRAFAREPELADVHANTRSGLDRIAADLTMAGFNTPPNLAVMWRDGGGGPDELSIIYADPEVPISRPKPCGTGGGNQKNGGGPCNTIGTSSTLNLDPYSMNPVPLDYETAYRAGMILFALQGPNGDPACDGVAPAIVPFEVTQPPNCTGAGGTKNGPVGCATLMLNHNPGKDASGMNPPNGFDNDVSVDCAVIGLFHVVQYRLNPLPPAENPSLERRDVVLGEDWSPVAGEIEDLQVQYVQGFGDAFQDEPTWAPMTGDPSTWVSQVRVTVSGRSAMTDLEGSSVGAFADGARLRRSFTTTMSLRNQLYHATESMMEPGVNGWN